MSISTRNLPGTTYDPLYPDSDGEPMGETDYHGLASVHLFTALRRWYRSRQDVHVAINMLLYYEEGNPLACRCPDIMVSKGVRGNHPRLSFRTWEEGVAPTVIIELTSPETRREDNVEKPRIYAKLGVKEYFLFDPWGDYLQPRLQGFQLAAGKYVPLEPDHGQFASRELGLRLAIGGYLLRLVDPSTGERLPTDDEMDDRTADCLRQTADAKRRTADFQRQTADFQRQTAEFEREIADADRQSDAERQRAAMLEAQLARLRAAQPTMHK